MCVCVCVCVYVCVCVCVWCVCVFTRQRVCLHAEVHTTSCFCLFCGDTISSTHMNQFSIVGGEGEGGGGGDNRIFLLLLCNGCVWPYCPGGIFC